MTIMVHFSYKKASANHLQIMISRNPDGVKAELILSSMKKVDIQPSIRYTQFRTTLQWLLYKINNSVAFILRIGECKKWQSDIKK